MTGLAASAEVDAAADAYYETAPDGPARPRSMPLGHVRLRRPIQSRDHTKEVIVRSPWPAVAFLTA
jgi:hypothetical protein